MRRIGRIAARYRFIKSEAGVTAIEYGLVATLIALLIVAGVTLIGPRLAAVFTKVAATLQS